MPVYRWLVGIFLCGWLMACTAVPLPPTPLPPSPTARLPRPTATTAVPTPTPLAVVALPPIPPIPTITPTRLPSPTAVPPLRETYCLWPGDTLYDIALTAGADFTETVRLNEGIYTGFSGSTVHLPAGAMPPDLWERPRPTVTTLADLPFGESGYFLAADNRTKRVALTFDVGYVPENEPLFAYLASRNVQSTFFVLGVSMSKHPEVIEAILANGHELGNHSWSHGNMQWMTDAEILAELRDTETAVQNAFPGASTKPFFRAPFGALTRSVIQLAAQEGYVLIGWTVDSQDWLEGATSETIYERVITFACPGAIIVMHDMNAAKWDALPRIIDFLQANGYELVRLSELLPPVGEP
ncbi:MAG: polysaccharide deacetylase family protein [Chloroflexi bacterium]|nr:polysaccharide deacetylase family protein [Chloroflexota bacterium]